MADPIADGAIAPAGRLDVASVASTHAELLARSDQDVTVDLRDLEFLGALGLQVFISAAKTARINGRAFRFENVPEPVTAQFATMGMSPDMVEGIAK